jgi:hypothetical protein
MVRFLLEGDKSLGVEREDQKVGVMKDEVELKN